MPPLKLTKPINFGSFVVTNQVFHITPLSFALVNLKPLLPGHVLVSPIRVVPRFIDLKPEEVTDLFRTVQQVSRTMERHMGATSLNIAMQDGADAGQSVPHVHVHIIPRHAHDMDSKGGNDAIYKMLEGEDGDLGKALSQKDTESGVRKGKFPVVDDASRKPRSKEDMEEEAARLADEMAKDTPPNE